MSTDKLKNAIHVVRVAYYIIFHYGNENNDSAKYSLAVESPRCGGHSVILFCLYS